MIMEYRHLKTDYSEPDCFPTAAPSSPTEAANESRCAPALSFFLRCFFDLFVEDGVVAAPAPLPTGPSSAPPDPTSTTIL